MIDSDQTADALFLLGIILISFGAGTRLDSWLETGTYLPLILYGAFLVLGFKQLVLD